jgi:hypothetical protein
MPVTIIRHDDGSKSVIETDGQGAHHQFDINPDGSHLENGQVGEGATHQEVVKEFSRPGDLAQKTFNGDQFMEGMQGDSGPSIGPGDPGRTVDPGNGAGIDIGPLGSLGPGIVTVGGPEAGGGPGRQGLDDRRQFEQV